MQRRMKIGVITYQYAYNYGAVLQCLALQRVLLSLGIDAEAVDYRPSHFKENICFWRGWGIREGRVLEHVVKRCVGLRYARTMKEAFDLFRAEYIKLSPSCTDAKQVAQLVQRYDAVIAGSDQIWHFDRRPAYFLEWGENYHGRRISYAPCCAYEDQSVDDRENVRKWIMNVDYLSVRNQFSADLLYRLTGRSAEVVADPTLLIDLGDVARKVELPCEKFILTYTLGDEIQGGHAQVIKAIRKKVGDLPVVAVVPSAHLPHLAPWADHVLYTAGPQEWLYLIAKASFIYTDSFHGILFSLMNRRPFLSYYAEPYRAPRLS